MVVFSKTLHLWKQESIHFSFLFSTDSTVLGLEYNNLSKLLSNYSADTKRDNTTKYVYFILITGNEIGKKHFTIFDHSICFISGYLTV